MSHLDVDGLIKKIDARIAELEEKDQYKRDNDIIDNIESKIVDLQNNIDLIYQEYLSELDKLIGLDEVKAEVKKLVNYLIFVKKLNNKIKLDDINLNMIFRGNSGTGKTSVARIVAKILCELGFLTNNKVIETTPRDFIAGYIGQTAIKARETIDRAKGGVIFIDEAYTFSQSLDEDGHTFVYEAITEIIKEMETKETIFIFSGYNKEMDGFINLNPGIKSRVAYDINFRDYTKEELFLMFDKKLKKSGLKIDDDARELLLDKISDRMRSRNFGNGRMIDNLFNEIIREHASNNLFEVDDHKLLLISVDTIKNIKVQSERGMCFE